MCCWLKYIKPSILSPIPTLFRGSEFNCRVLMEKSQLGHQRRKVIMFMYLFIVSEGSASTYENVKKDCETKLFKA